MTLSLLPFRVQRLRTLPRAGCFRLYHSLCSPFFFLCALEDSCPEVNLGAFCFFFFLPLLAAASCCGMADLRADSGTSFTCAGAEAASELAGSGVLFFGATFFRPPLSGAADGHAAG